MDTIRESVTTLAEAGFKNIELSGGTKYYPEYESDLLFLREKYKLNYLVHNYFPPPKEPFFLNLASLKDDIYKKSIELCLNAIRLSKKLGIKHYGLHAGLLIDIKPNEAGKNISYSRLSNKAKALNRFREAWNVINGEAGDDLYLYIENNVLSIKNAKTFSGHNPLLLTDYNGYIELKQYLSFNLLLDIAHLNVSANSLGLDFDEELTKLLPLSNYIHISENDGLYDQNIPFSKNSLLLRKVQKYNLKDKYITLEVYDEIDRIVTSYDEVINLIESNN